MLAIARKRVPAARFVHGDAFSLPFEDGAFDRVFASFFYCHLDDDERARFVAEARRVAAELVIVASGRHPHRPPAGWEQRTLPDGSRWRVYKRYFSGEELARELGGELSFEGRYFLVVRAWFS